MIEYKLLHNNNLPVTLDEIGDISIAIGCIFPETNRSKVGDKTRITYGVNGHTFYVYCGERGTKIIMPKYEKEIKKTLKNISQLKFGRK